MFFETIILFVVVLIGVNAGGRLGFLLAWLWGFLPVAGVVGSMAGMFIFTVLVFGFDDPKATTTAVCLMATAVAAGAAGMVALAGYVWYRILCRYNPVYAVVCATVAAYLLVPRPNTILRLMSH
jgi:hypothetical protein